MGDVDQKREAGRHMVTDSEVEETKRKPSPTRAHLLTQKRDAQAQGHGRLWRKGKRCAGNGRTGRPSNQELVEPQAPCTPRPAGAVCLALAQAPSRAACSPAGPSGFQGTPFSKGHPTGTHWTL